MQYRTPARAGTGNGAVALEGDPRAGLLTAGDSVARALDIGPDSSVAERTIDITTVGTRSGLPRRIEIWPHHIDGCMYLTGMPVARSRYTNLRADPRFVVHLEHGVTADLPATVVPVDEPTRLRVITAVVDLQDRPQFAARVSRRQDPGEWRAQPAGRGRVRRRTVAGGVLGTVRRDRGREPRPAS